MELDATSDTRTLSLDKASRLISALAKSSLKLSLPILAEASRTMAKSIFLSQFPVCSVLIEIVR